MDGLRSVLAYRNKLSVDVDMSVLELPLAKNETYLERYSWLKTCGDRFVISNGLKKMRLSHRFHEPDLLLFQLIRDTYNHRGLFSLLVGCLKSPLGVNMRQNDNSTFLHTAAEEENFVVYDWLVEAGGNPELFNNKGLSARRIRETKGRTF